VLKLPPPPLFILFPVELGAQSANLAFKDGRPSEIMSSTNGPFRIVEHIIPAQHIREYPQATATLQEETLYLAVKQYIPLDNPSPQPGDVTIIGAHANGFPKVHTYRRNSGTLCFFSRFTNGAVLFRNSMSRCGKRFMRGQRRRVSGFGVSGWQTFPGRDGAG
jgi:hypothetical protein